LDRKASLLDACRRKKEAVGDWAGKKYRAHKEIWDTTTGEKTPADLWWTTLRHLQSGQSLFLVKARNMFRSQFGETQAEY